MSLETVAALEPQAYLNADARAGYADNGKISYSTDQAAMQLLRGEPGWSSALGQPFTVTYAYRATAPSQMPADTAGFARFNGAQIAAADLAFLGWSDVANIRFVRVDDGAGYSDNAAILLGGYTSGGEGSSAFSYFPGSTAPSSVAGDIWVNATISYNANPTLNGYGMSVLVHEIGHAIGLEHPGDYNASADGFLSYAANAGYYEDARQYTVMSYFGEWNTGADFFGAYPAAPMMDDIVAAQLAYGANLATRTGDTVYGFNATADRPWFVASGSGRLVFAVWDAGGSDTFDVSGYGFNQLIDLRPGAFSNVGGLTGNVAIAPGAFIEAAIGGSGADVIHGNLADNFIQGGAGADSIDGGFAGNDRLFGGDGADWIVGGPGFDVINGNKGADVIDGGAGGGDWLLGGQGDDRITGRSGNGIYNGNLGRDTVTGGDGHDIVRGGQGNDVLDGGPGADRLFGDLGDDVLTGGLGADIFHFAVGGGRDLVMDFNPAEDRLQLDGSPSYVLLQSGADAVVGVGFGGDQIILVGVQTTSLAGAILLA